ncbi:HesA/MoeB/ThiF family protein [Pelagibacteraceae bacterium]|nr:HesA/MoeB/ThiF family protein [Pelagibacteraceae bacterium]|tara:strand:+ start:467 stop:1222 length:756 start_codon:yes stop_codon:yes gene_type:complete
MKLSRNELLRYSKQIILKKIGVIGQKKISSAKVLVVGMGGLGCPLVLYLANTGLGNIGLVDDDKVDLSNLNRQIIFNNSDIGRFKVVQTKKFLNKINKKIKVRIYKNRLTKENIKKIINNYDIICDCSDNFTTRYLLNDFSLKSKKILISAAISKFDAHIFNFNFKRNIPCYRCFMPEIPDSNNKCDTEGILPTVAGIAGTLQANEVVNSIIGKKNELVGKMIVFNTLSLNFRKIKLTKNSNCIKDCKKYE